MTSKIFKFVIIQLFFLKIVFSQVLLTNRMVYDYNIGDTIHYTEPTSNCSGHPGQHFEMVFLQKQVTTNNIVYNGILNYIDIFGGMFPTSTGSSTFSLQVNELDSVAKYPWSGCPSGCLMPNYIDTFTDTLYLNGENKNVNERRYNTTFGINCYKVGRGYLIEGLGDYYDLKVNENADQCIRGKILKFYHKVGEAPWGSRMSFTSDVGIKESLFENQLLTFPTVVEDNFLNIEYFGEGLIRVVAISSLGKEEQNYEISENKNRLKLDLNPGFYLFKFQRKDSNIMILKKIIIN